MPQKETKDKQNEAKKICFLITPIGSKGDPVRNRVDQWMEFVYLPALGEKYKIVRADQYAAPGSITEQVIELVINADLAVIDYSGFNPNVMYEAAIRHLAEKPFIQIHPHGTALPFDINVLRSIEYDASDLKYPEKLVNSLKGTLEEIEASHYEQPRVVKEKFDLNKIFSDPEKFVALLRKHILKYSERISGISGREDGIVMVSDYLDHTNNAGALFLGTKRVVCPKCGTIKSPDYSEYLSGYAAEAERATFNLGDEFHYKCNNCGTEFKV